MEIFISDHACFKAERRDIPVGIIMNVAQSPQQEIPSVSGRTICQSKLFDPEEEKEMLFRVVVRDIKELRRVITAYKTSKIERYWR